MSVKDDILNKMVSRRKQLLQVRDELIIRSQSESSKRISTRSSGSSIIEDSEEELDSTLGLDIPLKKPRLGVNTKCAFQKESSFKKKISTTSSSSKSYAESNEKESRPSFVSNSLLIKRKTAVTNLEMKRTTSVNRVFKQKLQPPKGVEQFISPLKLEKYQNIDFNTDDRKTDRESMSNENKIRSIFRDTTACIDFSSIPKIFNNAHSTPLINVNDNKNLSFEIAVPNRESPNLPSVYASIGVAAESEFMHIEPPDIELPSEELNESIANDSSSGKFKVVEGAASEIVLNFVSKSIVKTPATTESKPKILIEESSTDCSTDMFQFYDKSWKENENLSSVAESHKFNLNVQEQILSQSYENNLTDLQNIHDNSFNSAKSVEIPEPNVITEIFGTISPQPSPHSSPKKNDSSGIHINCTTASNAQLEIPLRQNDVVASKKADTDTTYFASSPSILEQTNHQEIIATLDTDITTIIPNDHDFVVDHADAVTEYCTDKTSNSNELASVIKLESSGRTIVINQKRKKRQLNTKFLQSCLEDIEDEVLQDFSGDSSELWSGKDESESTTDGKNEDRKKAKRKTKKANKTHSENNEIPKKKQKKPNKTKLRKARKEKGLDYTTVTGIQKEARELQDNPCKEEKCPNKCYEISHERRKSLFDYFWGLNKEKKRDWILHNCQAMPIKRKKTKVAESRRSVTYQYFINEGEGRRQVCQQFIIKTLNISQKLILYTLANVTEGLSRADQRTRHAEPKYDENTKSFAKTYIESLPALPSHYNRKNSIKNYLPQEFKNVSNLYRLYRKFCEDKSETYLSEKMFKLLFSEYNYSFHVPKKDKCLLCTGYENNPNENTVKGVISHKKEKEATYKRFEFHQKITDSKTVVASFDLQKVLATPHGDSMMLYYSRKYAVYNFTVYESQTQKAFCYTWGESDGKRGSNEIGTCLQKYIQDVDDRGVEKLILYCDNCSGQNKNKVILSILSNFLAQSKHLTVIQVNYLLTGHTYMPVDSVHAVIEREVRRIIVWAPSQWPGFMETARKRPFPYQVTTLEFHDFINWEKVTDFFFTPTTQKNNNLRIKDIRVCTFKKDNPRKMKIKYSMAEDSSTFEIELAEKAIGKTTKRRRGSKIAHRIETRGKQNKEEQYEVSYQEDDSIDPNNLPRLYKDRLAISLAKYNDLKKLCNTNIIPKRFHSEYINLPHNNKTVDTLLDTDEEDNIKDDEEIV